VLVKDLEDVAGMRTTQGSALFADAPVAARDGLTPSRLRAAGAVIVGKTNLPEFATEGYSANLIFGATRNPWGLASVHRAARAGARVRRWPPALPPSPPRPTAGVPFGSLRRFAGW
jgi:Asp-tRNA(Asn)/Glu-tRNA(Gln) amidotransferase A subunit family amidase